MADSKPSRRSDVQIPPGGGGFRPGIGKCGIPIPAVLLSWATFVVAGGFNMSNRKL